MSDLGFEPREDMLWTRLEAAASQLAIQHQDNESMIEQIAEAKELVEDYIGAYERGRPFWSRDVMASLDRQIDALVQAVDAGDKDAVVTIEDVVGRERSWSLTCPGPPNKDRETYHIRYCVHQHMTHMSPKFPESMMDIETPIGIVYGTKPKPSGWSLAELEAAFRVHQAAWQHSTACGALISILGTSSTSAIRKIVCFGLGRLDDWAKTTHEKLATSVQRAATQHAAALTMVETLTAKQDKDGNTGGHGTLLHAGPRIRRHGKGAAGEARLHCARGPQGLSRGGRAHARV
ncbi:hypothetical protein LMH87_001778 [Akanthomyces muscarius]|uniref:Uncharacterized protein n=1 Tax=Akanthomyces muscarius TaxID=2231603 RepID=A0A9W8Q509_AKAMU|nr:hypothetical protein LMH87_001778 [Akanthomyces muscarius]KAJ4147240.1 hypothetical protein LMH87_001778 [Akanthomyces muscarius]